MHIKDLMSPRLSACRPEESLADAAGAMWGRDCGFVPVTDARTGVLVGVITDRDICMAAFTQGAPLGALPIKAHMAAEFATCRETDAIPQVMNLMREKGVRRLPVVDARGIPVGVVSINDLARFAALPAGVHLRDQLVKTLAGICTPRTEAPRPAPAEATA